ncbi:hypothetical protein [Nocardia sp. NPDC058497]|uniref:hypothetical protein n=1 Tax=Nocardia sp. NPDC058497 TaxID=3346529 RepID=UPI0036666449
MVVAIGGFAWTVRPDASTPRATVNYNAAAPLIVATPSPVTLAGFLQFRDDYRTKFGETLVDRLTLHEEFVSVTRRAPGDNDDWSADYVYEGGFQRSSTQVTTRQRDLVPIDLAQVNADALAAALATAVATARVPGGKVANVSIENDHWLRQPAISISVTNEANQSGRLYLALSGEVLKTSPFEG